VSCPFPARVHRVHCVRTGAAVFALACAGAVACRGKADLGHGRGQGGPPPPGSGEAAGQLAGSAGQTAQPDGAARAALAGPRSEGTAGEIGLAPGHEPGADPNDLLPQAHGLARERLALQVAPEGERWVDGEEARRRGLALVDLSDGFAPAIFQDGKSATGVPLPNRYRAVFVGLANDRSDGDGEPLRPGERNYLELYGIPPSLSVLRQRFIEDAERECGVDAAKLLAVDGIATWGKTSEKKELARQHGLAQRLLAAQSRAGVASLAELAAKEPRYRKDVKEQLRADNERAAFAEVEKRLICEGLLDPARHQPGWYDGPMRNATMNFQQKNGIFAQADLTRSTLEAMTRPPLQNDFLALRRVLAERAAHAGGVVEDGSAVEAMPPAPRGQPRQVPTYRNRAGEAVPVPDLVGQATLSLMAGLGLSRAADALAFFRRHPASDFRALRAAVRFPPLPEYYGPAMDLLAEIDRGDVWYDLPFDGRGKRLPQPRARFPSFTLFVRWRGEKVPLVCWRTTIGGWRSELATDGQEYYRYKESDVGPRVWRHIVASPVWLPPATSPLGSMVKTKWVAGAYPHVVNYDETGPGYLSAYGLVAGIHEEMRRRADGSLAFSDDGIRTHGSFDYLSLRGRYSHGCHRLYNNLAVRLFSFVLAHRHARALGPMALGFRRIFYWEGEIYDMRLPNRGFYYELEPPLPIETLPGTIKGKEQRPLRGYVAIPGLHYDHRRPAPVLEGGKSGIDDRGAP